MAGLTARDPLAPDAMLAAACARTGLDDFGDPAFREGLERLLAGIAALDLAPGYVAASAAQIGGFLDARLMAVEGWKTNPACLASPIERPLIIAGLVRSGTTALHQLLSLDPQFQGPEHWLTMAPMPRPARRDWVRTLQYPAIADRMAAYVAAAPEISDDHMMTAEGVEESLFILAQSFASNMWPSMWEVPDYDAWYRGRDDAGSYRYLADVLRLIGHGDDRRWLLKNPTDLYSMAELLSVFPDAMIVQTHRDPVAAMPSIASLIHASRRVFMGDRADPIAVGRREEAFWATALARAEAAREKAPGQFCDVEFKSFVADQMATVRAIYDYFGLVLSDHAAAAMRNWLDAHPRRAAPGPRYRPETYGQTAEGLARIFAAYRAARGYS
jgi:hypothetical protein